MAAKNPKIYLSNMRQALADALPGEGLEFRRVAANDLGGWNCYATVNVPGAKVDLGLGVDAFLTGDPRRRRLWMALYFTRGQVALVDKAFKACPRITNDDIVDEKVLHVAAGAAPDRFNLLRESIFGGTWISRYLDIGVLPPAGLLASQLQRFLGDTRAALKPFAREPRSMLEKRDLVQGDYWVRRTDRQFRERHLRRMDHRCQACGFRRFVSKRPIIDLHHIKPMADRRARAPRPSTVLVLCPNCHRSAHTQSPALGLRALRRLCQFPTPRKF